MSDKTISFGAELKDCRLCLDCDFVFSRIGRCPRCDRGAFVPLSGWVMSMERFGGGPAEVQSSKFKVQGREAA